MITWGEHRWSENDLTVAHAALITLISGADAWAQMNPFAGPMTLMQIVATFVAVADRRPVTDVINDLSLLPVSVLMAAVSTVE